MKRTIQEICAKIQETAVVVPAIFVVATLIATTSLGQHIAPSSVVAAVTLGGPVGNAGDESENNEWFIEAKQISESTQAPEDVDPGVFIIDNMSVFPSTNPEHGALEIRNGVITYKVQKGETLSAIAAKFGVSLNTVYWANKDVGQKALRVGQEITVLPISGIFHEVRQDETLESIAARYATTEARIAKYNKGIRSRDLTAGESIIIPDAKPRQTPAARRTNLPEFPGYYTLPTTGWNWGRPHNNNAVDIANSCGTPIYASAEGLVVMIGSPDNWNEGYGGYVTIEHPNNTKTKYAHTDRNTVAVGDYVLQGDTIGYIGNTGLTHGPTGCHLHFEVAGAKNPFTK